MEKKYHYFYKITNLINGKFYYGIRSTDNIPEVDPYMGSGKALKMAIKKYGRINFKKDILKLFSTRFDASEYERFIVTIDIISDSNCYNLITGGEGKNRILSEKVKKIISEKIKIIMSDSGRKRRISEVMKLRMSNPDERRKISEFHKGKIISDEQRMKMKENRSVQIITKESRIKSVATRTKNGKLKHTECTKEKMKLNSTTRKQCIIDGVLFNSLTDAALKYNISRVAVRERIKSKSDKFKNWNYI